MTLINSAGHSHHVVVIGGGPAGSSFARLLAIRGHRVTVVARAHDERRGLAESLPPSTRKVLAAVGALEAIESSGICRNSGNEVWWGSEDARSESFGGDPSAQGFQVWRPQFDRLLADRAVDAGATWRTGNVRAVHLEGESGVTTILDSPGGARTHLQSDYVVDCSGRDGVVARHTRRSIGARRTHAWIGMWTGAAGADAANGNRTLVETFEDGWVWSVPTSATRRCVTVMVDPELTDGSRRGRFVDRYREQLQKARHVRRFVEGAELECAWGCDASLYTATAVGSPRHLLVGDALSSIDPLSSFGVKKALTSAWMAAAVVHSALTRPSMDEAARGLFAEREREVQATSVRRSVEYARQAAERHDSPFWIERAQVPSGLPAVEVDDVERGDDLVQALSTLRRRPAIDLRPGRSLRFEWQPAIRGHQIELERAVASSRMRRAVRFIDNVDLTRLVDMASHYRQVGDLFEGYCRAAAPVPLPSFLKALAVLVASQMLESADGRP